MKSRYDSYHQEEPCVLFLACDAAPPLLPLHPPSPTYSSYRFTTIFMETQNPLLIVDAR